MNSSSWRGFERKSPRGALTGQPHTPRELVERIARPSLARVVDQHDGELAPIGEGLEPLHGCIVLHVAGGASTSPKADESIDEDESRAWMSVKPLLERLDTALVDGVSRRE